MSPAKKQPTTNQAPYPSSVAMPWNTLLAGPVM
jgi:hypothetical protein